MDQLHTLISDLDLEIELLANLKNRSIEQKQQYIGAGANAYYESRKMQRPFFKGGLSGEDYTNFIKSYFFQNNQPATSTIISLGCGNASKEKTLLLSSTDLDINYIGVDSSKEMLDIAKQELEAIEIKKQFICADFSSYNFRQELSSITKQNHPRIFAFLGSTIGNIPLTHIVDTLYNMLLPEDVLWLDVAARPDKSSETDITIFKHYTQYLEQKEYTDFQYSLLNNLGIPLATGEFTLQMIKEDAVGALKFQFGFLFKERVKISLRNESVTFLPGEQMDVGHIRVYDVPSLEKFFWEHEFECIASEIKGNKAQLLFRKAKK